MSARAAKRKPGSWPGAFPGAAWSSVAAQGSRDAQGESGPATQKHRPKGPEVPEGRSQSGPSRPQVAHHHHITTKRVASWFGRPSAEGFAACCPTCTATRGMMHAPECHEATAARIDYGDGKAPGPHGAPGSQRCPGRPLAAGRRRRSTAGRTAVSPWEGGWPGGRRSLIPEGTFATWVLQQFPPFSIRRKE